jgi:HAE1 family hydrophobic/amphiphilic exporter-1
VIATSLVLIAVFVPVSFFPGTTGILYRQFSLTIAFAIAISAFNALTLSPALAALFLRGEEAKYQQLDFLHIRPLSRAYSGFAHASMTPYCWISRTYAKLIHFALKLRYLLLIVFFAGLAATAWMYVHVPTGFIPQEDQGYLMIIVQAPPGASFRHDGYRRSRSVSACSEPRHRRSLCRLRASVSMAPRRTQALSLPRLLPPTSVSAKGHSSADIVASLGPRLFMVPGGTWRCLSLPPSRVLAPSAAFSSCFRI